MTADSDNETWMVDAGATIIQKKAHSGLDSLTPWERLVYCLWVADYGMRNAGDLETASEFYDQFQVEAQRVAKNLSLQLTHEAFSLSKAALEREYFERFDHICHEIRSIEQDD